MACQNDVRVGGKDGFSVNLHMVVVIFGVYV